MNLNRLITTLRKNVRRNPYQALAAFFVMFFTFFVITVFLILGIGSSQILNYYESKPQAIAFFKDNATDVNIDTLKQALLQTGKITSLNYISKAQALEIYKEKNKKYPALLELVTANILPSSLEISTQNPKDLEPIVTILEKQPIIEEVVYPKDVIDTLSKAVGFIRNVGTSVISFLMVFALLIIVMIIGFKIRIARTEIETMKLLGASKWFIRLPFLAEGIFYAVAGVLVAWIVSFTLSMIFKSNIDAFLGDLKVSVVSPATLFIILLIEIILAGFVGLLGSFLSVRRYLKL